MMCRAPQGRPTLGMKDFGGDRRKDNGMEMLLCGLRHPSKEGKDATSSLEPAKSKRRLASRCCCSARSADPRRECGVLPCRCPATPRGVRNAKCSPGLKVAPRSRAWDRAPRLALRKTTPRGVPRENKKLIGPREK